MEKVENLRQYIKEAFEEFHGVQKESRQFIDDFHNSAMEIFLKGMSSFRANLEAYLEMRNENLHVMLKNMNECLNQASAAHSDIADYRMQLMQACNHNIQPPFTTPEDEVILVNGQGIKDLQNISSEAEQYVLQISEIQEQTCTLMNTLWEDILQKINTMMSEAVIQMKKYDEELLRKAQEACQQGNGELDKATQVLENIEKVKQQIECLCQMFKEPEN